MEDDLNNISFEDSFLQEIEEDSLTQEEPPWIPKVRENSQGKEALPNRNGQSKETAARPASRILLEVEADEGKELFVLPTPGPSLDPLLERDARSEASAKEESRAFSFPYARAYDIQLDLMRNVFRAIEDRKFGIFESPTGTGKSLSLLCASLTWLKLNAQRAEEGDTGSSSDVRDSEEPDWVQQQHLAQMRSRKREQEKELQERISKARQREALMVKESKNNHGRFEKRARLEAPRSKKDNDDSDEDFLVDDYDSDEGGLSTAQRRARFSRVADQASSNLSAEVLALQAEFEAQSGRPSGSRRGGPQFESEVPRTTPKIFFASRTHSQLSQFLGELRKTAFGMDVQIDECKSVGESGIETATIRSVPIGSRTQLCLNEKVKSYSRFGSQAVGDRCRELITKKPSTSSEDKQSARCLYLPPLNDPLYESSMLDFRDHAFAKVRDIEDLANLGKEMGLCPYYGSQKAMVQAQLVALPYSYILSANMRAAMDIDLKDSVVIIDEAHNLVDTILENHTFSVNATQVNQATIQTGIYLDKFASKMKGSNESHGRQVLLVLRGLNKFCDQWVLDHPRKEYTETLTAIQLLDRIGGNLDQVNLIKLQKYLEGSRIAHKISGYADKEQAKIEGPKSKTEKQSMKSASLNAMRQLETFIASLVNPNRDGRIMIKYIERRAARTTFAQEGEKEYLVELKYQLLNPADPFQSVLSEARSVVLAGGTMEPISDLKLQLAPGMNPSKFAIFSCPHIIPPSNLLACIIPRGPLGREFCFTHANNHDIQQVKDAGNAIVNFCNIVPHGIVVFATSYSKLASMQEIWIKEGIMARIEKKKRIFQEPKTTLEIDGVLSAYRTAINEAPTAAGHTGALMFAVVGGKLSEGINFSDKLARAVVMLGQPFPNLNSPELQERKKYLFELQKRGVIPMGKNPAKEMDMNSMMKAVNQSIGRAIRHQNDYAALLLIDVRYRQTEIKNRLPGWIREHVVEPPSFGGVMSALAGFFREKKGA